MFAGRGVLAAPSRRTRRRLCDFPGSTKTVNEDKLPQHAKLGSMTSRYTRRQVLATSSMAAALAVVHAFDAVASSASGALTGAYEEQLRSIYKQLTEYLKPVLEAATLQLSNGLTLFLPSKIGGYSGVWPDDSIYPFIADPKLAVKSELSALLDFLTPSVVEMRQLPDRVEPDGLPILSPGTWNRPPMTDRMPLHLPGAWVRLLSYYQGMGVEIPRKREWSQVVSRSFDLNSFACGLAYSDPQHPAIGFGFMDSVMISGFELMSSLVLYRGLQRALVLFQDEMNASTLARWKHLAREIPANLYRLYDPAIGGYVEGSRQGHQFSVWGNGLAYSLAPDDAKRQIFDFYLKNRSKIFRGGYTRQMAEPNGWEGPGQPKLFYQNGGFWGTGTGYVLPVLYDHDPTVALELANELVQNLPKVDYCEWLDPVSGTPSGAMGFLGSISVPAMGVRSILEKRPLIEYF